MSRFQLLDNPLAQFSDWFKDAQACRTILQANAMTLSTVDAEGFPDARMVLLKGFDERGFVFYTNLRSAKGRQLEKSPRAALTFHWDPLKRQVRIQGTTEQVGDAEADAYWVTRPRISQIGAWASLQSEPLPNNRAFIQRLSEAALQFGAGPVPRPPHWSGIRVVPRQMEFWRARRGRLHERFLYRREGREWRKLQLYP